MSCSIMLSSMSEGNSESLILSVQILKGCMQLWLLPAQFLVILFLEICLHSSVSCSVHTTAIHLNSLIVDRRCIDSRACQIAI